MLRTLKNLFKQDREKFVVPKSVQNVIPIKTIWEDGIFLVGRNKYAKTFKFEDINYAVASREDKEAMFLEYSELLNSPLVKAMQGEVIHISATSENHINAMDMNSDYGDGANPVILKSEFILSLCEQLIGGTNLGAKQKSIIDRCTASVYRYYQQGNYMGTPPTLQDFREELLKQNEPEAQENRSCD